jgi:hypothetical protein
MWGGAKARVCITIPSLFAMAFCACSSLTPSSSLRVGDSSHHSESKPRRKCVTTSQLSAGSARVSYSLQAVQSFAPAVRLVSPSHSISCSFSLDVKFGHVSDADWLTDWLTDIGPDDDFVMCFLFAVFFPRQLWSRQQMPRGLICFAMDASLGGSDPGMFSKCAIVLFRSKYRCWHFIENSAYLSSRFQVFEVLAGLSA